MIERRSSPRRTSWRPGVGGRGSEGRRGAARREGGRGVEGGGGAGGGGVGGSLMSIPGPTTNGLLRAAAMQRAFLSDRR